MLSYNVAGLLKESPGASRTFHVELPPADLPIAEDLELAGPVEGDVKLARTGRGILARGHFETQLAETCARCLKPIATPVTVDIEEEALPSIDLLTGRPMDVSEEPDALRLDEHHELDLEPTVRDAISLAESIRPLCRPDCAGLCVECGADLNLDRVHRHEEEALDPRLAALLAIREQLEHHE